MAEARQQRVGGVHFDFGNNLSLSEIPWKPWRTCDGFLDLKGMVESLRAKDPNMPFNLEMITRDPLKIPVLTPAYWATFDDAFSLPVARCRAAIWRRCSISCGRTRPNRRCRAPRSKRQRTIEDGGRECRQVY